MSNSRPYSIWSSLKTRCKNKKANRFNIYGGKGITYDPKWESFEMFWSDMKDGYQDNLTIDRIDNNKGYYKENCRWATPREQSNNKTNNRLLTFNNKTLTVAQWARKLNINYSTLSMRLNVYKWSIKKSLT